MKTFAAFASLAGLAAADLLWDGRFNDLESSTDLGSWSWSNQVGPYQYYIHGDGEVTEYVNLAASFGNPDDAGSSQGAKITLTDTAYWNGQTMRRTELIPQTSAAIAAGKVFYHFSIKRSDENAPSLTREHQIAFFESHFTELKSGANSGATGEDNSLRWLVGGTSEWEVDWEADVWHNMAYEIDFDASTVGLWHSTGASDLKQVVAPVTADTSSNGADWHVGVLELANGDADETEDFYFSGVYIEDGDITTSVSGPGGASSGGSSGAASSAASSAAAAPTAATSTAAAAPTAVTTSVAAPTSAADATTLVSKVVSQVASEAVSTAPATSAAVVATSVAEVPSVVETTSVAQATSVAQVTATPIESSAVLVTATSSSAAATATQKSPCKLSRRSRRARHRRS
ncbi:hypothetical protein B0J13DRAFT_226830 [Dactylonectria estremocensis]|uniref:Glycoside hydrolase 131 catalytic N-terminal domain-containing protein n=1 Tax=Dactylonectria estremocensis TaxID=1079267 RepID=A0A9P9F7S0_9HYPO|nr:hypothetical protein B0J13DRAFT_226830 [Dactylonectria estremocensis]